MVQHVWLTSRFWASSTVGLVTHGYETRGPQLARRHLGERDNRPIWTVRRRTSSAHESEQGPRTTATAKSRSGWSEPLSGKIPRSGGSREQNFEIFDFELGPDDMAAITGLNRNERTGPDPDTFAYIPS